jgi:hypothetical protein
MIELDHAHAALGEAAGEEAVRSKGTVAGLFHAVAVKGRLIFFTEIGQLGDAALHLEGHLVLGDARRDLGIVLFLREESVEPLDLFDDLALGALADAVGVADVVDRVTLRLELNPLETTRQHAAAPLPRRDGLLPVLAREVRTMKPGRSSVSDPSP